MKNNQLHVREFSFVYHSEGVQCTVYCTNKHGNGGTINFYKLSNPEKFVDAVQNMGLRVGPVVAFDKTSIGISYVSQKESKMKILKSVLTAMELTISMTVWKSQDECLGYLKAIREIRLILNDLPNIPETLSKD